MDEMKVNDSSSPDSHPELPQNSNAETEMHESNDNICRSCGSPDLEPGYLFPLCAPCRSRLSQAPLPKWIIGVALLIVAGLALALTQFPKAINAAVYFEQGQQAEKAKLYDSAAEAYQKASKINPDSTLIIGRLVVAQYGKGDIYGARDSIDGIAGRETDEELADEVNQIVEKMDIYYPTEAFYKEFKDPNVEPTAEQLAAFAAKNPEDVMARYLLAGALFDQKKFAESEKEAQKITNEYPYFLPAISLSAAIHRERKDYEKCRAVCNRMLELNAEDYYAFKSLAEIELKLHNDQQALKLAQKAYDIEPNNGQNLAILSLAYHYNGNRSERDKIFKKFVKLEDYERFKPNYLRSIFDSKVVWR